MCNMVIVSKMRMICAICQKLKSDITHNDGENHHFLLDEFV